MEDVRQGSPVRLVLELDPDADPPSGVVERDDGSRRPFTGLLELLALLSGLGGPGAEG